MTNKFDEIMHNDERESHSEPHSKKRDKTSSNVKEITIRFKPIVMERIIYSLVILILVFFVIKNPFCGVGPIEDDDIVEGDETNQTAALNQIDAVTPESDGDGNDEPEVNLEIDAALSFTKNDITLENVSDKFKVEKINFKVVNSGGILRGKIKIYWYDEDSTDVMKEKVRASKSLIIPAGETMTFSATDFSGSYLESEDDEKETFVIELVDSEDEILDSKEIELTT